MAWPGQLLMLACLQLRLRQRLRRFAGNSAMLGQQVVVGPFEGMVLVAVLCCCACAFASLSSRSSRDLSAFKSASSRSKSILRDGQHAADTGL
jgi:hypothetical protein